MKVPLPTIAEYEQAILEVDGPYCVNGRFFRDQDRAAIARRTLAEVYHRQDLIRKRQIEQLMQAELEVVQ